MKKIKWVLLMALSISCNFFGPVDSSTMKQIELKPNEDQIIGNWFLDEFSFRFLENTELSRVKKTNLIIDNKGRFEMINFPRIRDLNLTKDSINLSFQGEWYLQKSFNDKFWELKLKFQLSKNENRSMIFKLYDSKNDGLIFWKFIGDPDTGNRLLFKKSID